MIIGTGSTTLELAKLLSIKSGFKIFTDSLPVASLLIQSENQVFLFGGELRNKSSSVYGGWTVAMINQIHVDFCFLGTDGFSNSNSPSSHSSSDAYIDQVIIAHSEQRFILADYSKFTRKSLYKICDWCEVTGLITNQSVDTQLVEQVTKQTKVITC